VYKQKRNVVLLIALLEHVSALDFVCINFNCINDDIFVQDNKIYSVFASLYRQTHFGVCSSQVAFIYIALSTNTDCFNKYSILI